MLVAGRRSRAEKFERLTNIPSRNARRPIPDLREFIRTNLPLAPVRSVPEICLHQATQSSGLRRLGGFSAPYWAYPWAGGLALARHMLDNPETASGRRVLDLGAGSGLVGIAAAKAGAREVMAAEVDSCALAALAINAEANRVTLSVISSDLTAGPPPSVELIVVGDLFYERLLAGKVTTYLERCVASGVLVLVGDPGRAFLPRSRLRRLAEYPMRDVGEAPQPNAVASTVFQFE
jgi:predicted nicotinamide N-methyase